MIRPQNAHPHRRRSLVRRLSYRQAAHPWLSGAAGWKFDAGTLIVEWAGSFQTFQGDGAGQGSVRVPAHEMRALAAMPPHRGEIEVSFADGWLRIGSFSMRAEGESGDPKVADYVPQLLALNPLLRHLVALPYHHGEDVIDAAHLTGAVAEATAERLRRTERAASALAPLGITPEALGAWIDEQLARR